MKSRLVVWFVFVVTSLLAAAAVLADDTPDVRTIRVTGESEIRVVPDKVVIVLGVEKIDKDMVVVKQQCDDLVKSIIKAARRNGVGESDVASEYFNVEPKYYRNDQKDTFLGYQFHKRIAVTLNDISKYENLVSDLLDAGVVSIQSVQFQTSELRKHRDEARAKAIAAAREKAIAMASELGLKIDKAHSIDETGSRWYSLYGGWYDYGYGRNISQNLIQEASSTGETPMALGKISVTASVSVSFELQ